MKIILLSLFLILSFSGFSQTGYQDLPTDLFETSNLPEENYSSEELVQREEDFNYPTLIQDQDEYLAEEEVYDDHVEYEE